MKKNMILMMALVAIAAMATFTSCVTPDDTKRIVDYKMVVSQDLLDLCDVTVLYKGVNGKDTLEAVNDTVWKRSVVNDTLPFKFGMCVKAEPKPGVTLDKEICNLKAEFYYMLVKWNYIQFSYGGTLIDKHVPSAQALDTIMGANLNPSDWFVHVATEDSWIEEDSTYNDKVHPRHPQADLQKWPYRGTYEHPQKIDYENW